MLESMMFDSLVIFSLVHSGHEKSSLYLVEKIFYFTYTDLCIQGLEVGEYLINITSGCNSVNSTH